MIFDEGKSLSEKEFVDVTISLGLSRYLNSCLFSKCVAAGSDKVTFGQFQTFWTSISSIHHSDHSFAFAIMKQSQNNYLLSIDVAVAIQGFGAI